MYYSAIYNVYSLKMMQYLVRAGFDVVKIKIVPDESLVIFGFELSEELIASIKIYNDAVAILNNKSGGKS